MGGYRPLSKPADLRQGAGGYLGRTPLPLPVHSAPTPILLLFALASCTGPVPQNADKGAGSDASAKSRPLLVEVPADSSGIHFANLLNETDTFNYFKFEYMYNGGGVAVGDVNGDSLPDLYFTGNTTSDRLYLNKGDLRFEDITTHAIPGTHQGFHSGVSMADVNGDGRLDIYVCRTGPWKETAMRTNLLYINNGGDKDGVPTFTERAKEFGIADTSRSTQGIFFDHDRDGDLDLYVLNTPLQGKSKFTNQETTRLIARHASPTSILFRNDGGHFTNITAEAGLWTMGYSLGVAVSDLDGNGREDIYVANDYIEPDKMWLANGSGAYVDAVRSATRHNSNFGMGCDAADYDNDGFVDLMVLDMVSEDHVRSKKNMGGMSSEKFWGVVSAGFHYQYMFNTLQHNNGNGSFSEVGQLAGVSKTDWSWAPLFCDLDNDGWKDLMITNGYKRDMRDNDYMITAKKLQDEGAPMTMSKVFALVPSTKIRNYLYRNTSLDSAGNKTMAFQDVSVEWGFNKPENSNGAAYADLDNDGDLDLVINNLDETASLYANQAVQQGRGHYLRVALEGAGGAGAMGAQVRVRAGGIEQLQELMLTRGFQSSVEPVLHFGLGSATVADEVRVTWPDGKVSVLNTVPADHVLNVLRASAVKAAPAPAGAPPLLSESAKRLGLDFVHVENAYDDFKQEVLLPHKQSENGPLLSTGDANGDGRDDLFVGGARGQSGALYVQNVNGTFSKAGSQPWEAQKASEDMGSLFFDADGDGDQDLYVVSGSNETDLFADQYFNRLYLNDGHGAFTHSPTALPPLATSAMRVTAADIDGDRDLDLFVGGRITPGQYPRAPRSYLLMNDAAGHFSDATEQLAPDLLKPGLVTDAEFIDYDGDKDPDLVLLGEWMPISFYENTGGKLVKANEKSGLKDTEGWWWSLTSGDIDGDGDPDLVCGNIGWNNKFHCSPEHPFHVYWGDFDDNGHNDIVLAKENQQIGLVPVRGRECSSQQCAMIEDKFPTYDAFAHASLEQIYTPEKLSKALHLEAKHMRSCVLVNEGGGRFTLNDLPGMAQAAPIMGSTLFDANGDGHMDLVIAGNHWGAEVETVRYDAGTGLVLLGDGAGNFQPMTIARSGLFAWGNVKDLALLNTGPEKKPLIVVANNNDRLQAFAPSDNGSLLGQRR